MKTVAVCIPLSKGHIERLKALYPTLKDEILKKHPKLDMTVSTGWIETFEFILNRE